MLAPNNNPSDSKILPSVVLQDLTILIMPEIFGQKQILVWGWGEKPRWGYCTSVGMS